MQKAETVPGKDKILGLAIVLSLSAYICLYLVLAFYAHPSADDYAFANKLINEGFLNSQVSWYLTWTGRYASTWLITAYLALFNIVASFWFLPLSLILATCASFVVLFLSLPKGLISPRQAVCSGLGLTALYLSGLPSTSEIIYWLAGAITYQIGNSLYLLLLAALVMLYRDDTYATGSPFWAASFLVLVNAGMNETVMFLQSLTLALTVLYAFGKNLRQRYLLLALLILSMAGAAVVIVAPGNAVRSTYFPLAHDFVFSIHNSVLTAARTFVRWSASGPLWLATLIWFPLASVAVRNFTAAKPQLRAIAAAALAWLSLLTLMYFPAFWSMGSPPPVRTLSICYLLFVTGWFVTVSLLAARFRLRDGTFSVAYFRFVSMVFAGSLFATGNGAIAVTDLSIAPGYSAQLNERYELLTGGKTGPSSDILVPVLKEFPATIHFTDISSDREEWKNVAYAEFFHLRSIATTRGKRLTVSQLPTRKR